MLQCVSGPAVAAACRRWRAQCVMAAGPQPRLGQVPQLQQPAGWSPETRFCQSCVAGVNAKGDRSCSCSRLKGTRGFHAAFVSVHSVTCGMAQGSLKLQRPRMCAHNCRARCQTCRPRPVANYSWQHWATGSMMSCCKERTRRLQLGQGCHWAAAQLLVAAAAVAHPHR